MNLAAPAWRSLVGSQPLEQTLNFHGAVGCDGCRSTGSKDRQGLYEILTITESLTELIQPETPALTLRRHALQQGMQPLRRAGALKVAARTTTLEEVLSVTPVVNLDEPAG
jgi:general secretion pathway protein E